MNKFAELRSEHGAVTLVCYEFESSFKTTAAFQKLADNFFQFRSVIVG